MKLLCLSALLAGLSLAAPVTADDIKDLPKDQQFLVKAIEGATAEIKLAELADKRAESADVKKFAQMMIEDHTRSRKELLEKAGDLKVAVVTGLSKEHKDTVKTLSDLEGKEFDRAYIKTAVASHARSIKLFEAQVKEGKNEQVTACAEKALPTIRKHLEHARKIQETVK